MYNHKIKQEGTSMIKIENLNVTYNQTPALSNINLEIKGPGITGIIGPNGAGKSTFQKLMIKFQKKILIMLLTSNKK